VANSFDGGTTKKTPWKTAFLTERNRCLNFLYFLEIPTLLKLFPSYLLLQLLTLSFGKNRSSKIAAQLWILGNIHQWYPKRVQLQEERKVKDTLALQWMSGRLFSETEDRGMKNTLNRISIAIFRFLGLPFQL
jgi:hypothetical protein